MTSQERPVEEQNELEQQNDNGAVAVAEELPAQQTQEETAETAEQVATSSAADVERTESATGQLEATTEEQAAERAVGETAAQQSGTAEPEAAVEETAETAPASEEVASEEASFTPVAEETSEEVSFTPVAEETSEEVSFTPVTEETSEEASFTPVAEETSEEASFTPVAEETSEEASFTPVAEETSEEASFTPAAEETSEEASFTPVAEETSEEASFTPVAEETSEEASFTPVAEETSEEASFTPVAEETSEEASFTPVAEETSGKPRRVKDLQAGMELEGRVTSIALYGIFVDIGVGRDGLVHISEMSNTRIDSPSDLVQIGDTVKVRVKSVEPDGRRISLTMRTAEGQSRRRNRKPELDRERLGGLQVGDAVEGTVTGIAPFGVFVDIGVGKDGLVHISELSEGRIDKAEDAVTIGQSYNFKILEVDAEGTRISLSLRRAQRAQRLQGLDKGQILEGTISGIAPFGAFVDIGVGRDGLVHISELSEDRVGQVEDVVKVGDKVQVRVLEMEANSKRISLSMVLHERAQDEQQPVERNERGGGERTERTERASADRTRREFPSLQDRQERQERVRNERRRDDRQPMGATTEVYATTNEEPEVVEPANATLEDLLSKFGSNARRGDKKRRPDEEDGEESEEGEDTGQFVRRQRDAIRRTIQTMGDDE